MLPAQTLPPGDTPPRVAQLIVEQRLLIEALSELLTALTPKPERAKGRNGKSKRPLQIRDI